jgi:Fe-S oxidoreductase
MLDTAKMMLQQILSELRPHIAAGTPLIGLEPSCVSVFRDEMVNLLAHNQDAERLKEQTFLLSEFLIKKADYHPPQLQRKAIVHGHCHHKSILKFDSEQELMKRMGLDFKVLDSGCCGMAGSFGFEEGKFEISKQIGERVLLPAVREASRETIIIADGFSCFEQIDSLAGRKPLHISEVLQMAIAGEEGRRVTAPSERRAARTAVATVVGASAVAAAGAALYFSLRPTHNGHGGNGGSRNGHRKPSERSNVKELQPR